MKFCQLKEYNKKNVFLQKPCIKCGGKILPIPSLKVKIEHISLQFSIHEIFREIE